MTKINWQLYIEDTLIINNLNVEAEVTNENICYTDEFGKHIIDKLNRTYQRIGDSDEMIIDFKKNSITFKFDGQVLEYDIESSFETNDKSVFIVYTLGDEKKKLLVTERRDNE